MNWSVIGIVVLTVVIVGGILAVLMVAFRNRPEMPEDEPESFGDAFNDRKPTSPPMPKSNPNTRRQWSGVPVEGIHCQDDEKKETDNSFINSAAMGYMLNDGIMGGMIGGNLAGGIVGDVARDGVIGSQPEASTSYEMPTQSESPSFDSSSTDSGFSGGSDMGGGDF